MQESKKNSDELYVVGIGASAGGLDALQKLFSKIPENTGMAFVVIQHLSPDFVSMMPELLSKHTKMPIYTAEDKMTIKPNSIYLNRRNKNLHIKGKQLYLLDIGPKHNLNLPIDIFFHTLGEEFKEKSIGIVLSGTGSDGSRGIKTIKGAGGIVIVQSPETAQFDGMPNSAIATNAVDFLLPPEEIAEVLEKIPLEKIVFAGEKGVLDSNELLLKNILDELHLYFGIDFNQYKPSTIQRRLANRLKILNFDSLKEYLDYLRINKNEKELLKKDLLIGVTQFFRDAEAFNALRNLVIPAICNNKKNTDTIRIWSAGCSTGEEAYTLAILFDEYIRLQKLNVDFKIFATDVEPAYIQIASEGIYYINSISEINRNHLEQYFVKSGDKIQIIKRIREKIVFSKHNLTLDPPFIKMDLILCRNLLIYLNNKLQERVLQTFLFSLNKNGYLFLGNSESIPESLKNDFLPIDMKWKIFQSASIGKYVVPQQDKKEFFKNKNLYKSNFNSIQYTGVRFKEKLQSKIYQFMSKRYSPDAVIVDNNFEIIFISGNAGKYLSHSEGVFQTNLLDTLNREMAILIRNAVKKLDEGKKDVTLKKGIIKKSDKNFISDITLHKIENIPDLNNTYLIQFSEPKEITGEEIEVVQFEPDEFTQQQIKELENELQFTKAELQNAMEELETSNEELQASNEELMASNEELQSTNEELQSVNEELYTVNSELQEKNRELQYLNDEINNLLNSTDIAVLYLDENLNIRKFTPALQKLFDLHEGDIGRPIANFASGFYEEYRLQLLQDAKDVLRKLTPIHKETKSINGKYYLKRIHPFLTAEKKVDGVIISFVDITKIKEYEEELIAAKEKAEESERLKTAFLANMSHEIRTPMNGILGFLNLLKEADLDETTKDKYIEIISHSGERLLNTINSIIEISQIDAGTAKVNESEFSLNEVIRNQFQLLDLKAKNKKIDYNLILPDNEIFVRSDKNKLESILTNLVDNAIKYTRKGYVNVSLLEEADKLVLSVSDSGKGIPDNLKDKIFLRFHRLSSNETDGTEGNGLGLSIVKSYVEMLGATLKLDTEVGKGTTFTVSFNKDIIVDKPVKKKDIETVSSQKLIPNANFNILVGEDDDISFELLRRILRPYEFNLIRARTGKEVIDLFKDNPNINLILMDVKMPELDGLEAAKQILKIKPGFPIIAQTAFAFPEDRENAIKSGCKEYIEKPITPEKLLDLVIKFT